MITITASQYSKSSPRGMRSLGLLLLALVMETAAFAEDTTPLQARMQILKENDPEWSNEIAPRKFATIERNNTEREFGYIWQDALDIKTKVEEAAKSEKQPIWRSKEGRPHRRG